MNRIPTALLALSAVTTAGLAFIACSDQNNRRPASGPLTTAAGITGSPQGPQGPFPRGQVTPASLPNPATIGPVLSVASPTYNTQTPDTAIRVAVEALDGDGVSSVEIGGVTATAIGNDLYEANVPLVQGLNAIPIEAMDALGNTSYSYISVTQGLFVPDDSVYTTNIAVSLTQGGLARLDTILASQLSKIDLAALLPTNTPIYNSALLDVTLTGVRHAGITPRINGAPNGVTLLITFQNLEIDALADVIGFTLAPATLSVTQARATVEATIDRSVIPPSTPVKQALGLRIDRVGIDLNGFDVKTTSGALNTVLSPFRGVLQNIVEGALEDAVVDLADTALSGSITGIDTPAAIPLTGLGAGTGQLGLQVEVDRANGVPGVGLDIIGGAKFTNLGPVMPGATRNVFVHGAPAQLVPAAPGDQFAITLSSDVINGLLHSAWVQGALGVDIDGTLPPTSPSSIPLNVSFLYPFLPPVRDLAPDPLTPIVIEVHTASAPLVEFPTFGPALGVQGEVEITLLIDYMDGGSRLELFTLRAALALQGEVNVNATELELKNLKAVQAALEVVREPAADVADQEIERFFNAAVPFLVDEFATKALPKITIPGLPLGLQLTNPRLEVAPGFLTVRGGL